jgi:SPP1 gp7 family putative phage head morphogenesis protein
VALKSRSEAASFLAVSEAIKAFEKNFEPNLKRLLEDTRNASAKAAVVVLKRQLSVRAASLRAAAGPTIKSWGFDASNPAAQKWVEEHATELITDLSDTTREDIKDLLEQAFEGDFDVDQLTQDIADAIGDDERADLIARTETMRASNEGQQEAWDQAVEEGLLTGTERQEWIVTPDDRLCPICEPMDGVVTDLDGYFDVDGDQIDGPPAHPRCRCTIGLVV